MLGIKYIDSITIQNTNDLFYFNTKCILRDYLNTCRGGRNDRVPTPSGLASHPFRVVFLQRHHLSSGRMRRGIIIPKQRVEIYSCHGEIIQSPSIDKKNYYNL